MGKGKAFEVHGSRVELYTGETLILALNYVDHARGGPACSEECGESDVRHYGDSHEELPDYLAEANARDYDDYR